MRLCNFDLLRFGHFTDTSLEFKAPEPGEPDLHLLVGRNEAGKSTFRAALSEFLFRFDRRTAFGFAHGNRDLRLRARLSSDNNTVDLVRRKADKLDLEDANGKSVPEAVLASLLGGVDKATYQREYALDHHQLIDGGKRVLDNQSDLSQLLFEAASGLGPMVELQRTLEAESKEIWTQDRRNSKTKLAILQRQLRELDTKRRETELRSTQLKSLSDSVQESESAFRAADSAHAEVKLSLATLNQLTAAAALIDQLARLDAAEAALDIESQIHKERLRALPETASAQVRDASQEEARRLGERRRLEQQLEHAEQELKSETIDPRLLAQAARIEQVFLEFEQSHLNARELDTLRQKRSSEFKRAQQIAQDLGVNVGRGEGGGAGQQAAFDDLATYRAVLPARVERLRLDELLLLHSELEPSLRAAHQTVERVKQDLNTLNKRQTSLAQLALTAQFETALRGAQLLGNFAASGDRLKNNAGRLEQRLREQLAGLTPWAGTLDALQQLKPPNPREVDQAREALQSIKTQLREKTKQRDELLQRALTQCAERDAHAKLHNVPQLEELIVARAARDQLLEELRGSPQPQAFDTLSKLINDADVLADRRLDGAHAIAKQQQLEIDIARLEAELNTVEKQCDALSAQHKSTEQQLRDALSQAGVLELDPSDYRQWLDLRKEALKTSVALAEVETEKPVLMREIRSATTALLEAGGSLFDPLGQSPKAETDLDHAIDLLQRLLAKSAELQAQFQNQQGELAALERQQQELQERLGADGEKLEQYRSELHSWNEKFQSQLARCNLPANTTAHTARSALDMFNDLSLAINEIARLDNDEIEPRVIGLRRATESADEFTDQFLKADSSTGSRERITELATRARKAQEQQRRSEQLNQQIERLSGELKACNNALIDVYTSLEPFRATLQLSTEDGLDVLQQHAETSNKLRSLDRETQQLKSDLFELGENRDFASLKRELATSDPASRRQQRERLESEVTLAEQARDVALQAREAQRNALGRTLSRASQSVELQKIEVDRQAILAEMAEIAQQFVQVHLRQGLLDEVVERYRAANQSPLLINASAHFARLTCGRYSSLQVDDSGARPKLITIPNERAAPREIGALSDGTRDQLFLALRIAALELRIESGVPLPVVADDLFINFDDERTAAGLKVLAHLARSTQVICLTHHQHLVELSRAALSDQINIIELN